MRWMQEAACKDADPELFFATDADGQAEAVAWCMTCPVVEECLDHAEEHNVTEGVWGGMLQEDRWKRRRRAQRSRRQRQTTPV